MHRRGDFPVFGLALASLLIVGTGCAGARTESPPPQTNDGSSQTPQKTLAQRAVDRVADVGSPLSHDGDDEDPKDGTQRTSIPIPGSPLVHGRSTITVNAPVDKVRAAVLDFDHYVEFMPHYRASRQLGRTRTGGRDVYMEVEALHGAVKMSAEIEVAKPAMIDGVETYATTFIKGKSVKDFQAVWRLKQLEDGKTELSLEIFLDPVIQLPASLQNEENVKGSADGVLAMRARAEAH